MMKLRKRDEALQCEQIIKIEHPITRSVINLCMSLITKVANYWHQLLSKIVGQIGRLLEQNMYEM